jgi:hypothetical protein
MDNVGSWLWKLLCKGTSVRSLFIVDLGILVMELRNISKRRPIVCNFFGHVRFIFVGVRLRSLFFLAFQFALLAFLFWALRGTVCVRPPNSLSCSGAVKSLGSLLMETLKNR